MKISRLASMWLARTFVALALLGVFATLPPAPQSFTPLPAALMKALPSSVSSADAASMSDYLENAIADHIFRTTTYTAPSGIYVSLHTAACSDSSTGTEVSGGNYARANVGKSNSAWRGTHASTTGASSGTGGTVDNASSIPFNAPSANWGVVTHFAIFDASTSGNMLFCAALTTSKTINNGDAAPSFAANALTVQIDN